MKNHLLRPLWCVLAAIALILIAGHFMVPDDFGVHGESFTYNYHRLSAVDDWKNFPAKYKGRDYCNECHADKVEENGSSGHRDIQCENCHGPAFDHPDDPERLTVDRGRDLCLRCHDLLPYPGSLRGELPGIDPGKHNPEYACADCHNPHYPDQEVD